MLIRGNFNSWNADGGSLNEGCAQFFPEKCNFKQPEKLLRNVIEKRENIGFDFEMRIDWIFMWLNIMRLFEPHFINESRL